MRILVTGGLGFVGRAVARELVGAGHRVDVLSRGRRAAQPPEGCGVVIADIRDRDRLAEVVQVGGYDGMCHLAALTSGRESVSDPLSYWEVNVGGTVNLLGAVVGAARPVRLVFASSSIVYGSQSVGALGEDVPVQPTSPYGHSKVAAEQAVRDVAMTGALDATVLRLFNVAGAVDGYGDDDPTRIIPNVLRAARGTIEQVNVNGDGSAVREFAHVVDVAVAFRLALVSGRRGHVTFNVGTGKGVTVRDVIATAEAVTGKQIAVNHLPPKLEPQTLVSDPTAIIRALGWRPSHSSLAEIIESAYRAGHSADG